MLGDVHLGRHHAAVQAFIEQQVGLFRQGLPGREGTGRLLVRRRFLVVVQVFAPLPVARFGVAGEQFGEFGEQVVVGSEVAEMLVTTGFGGSGLQLHFLAVKAVKAVAFNHRSLHFFAPEDVLESARHRGGACARRAGDGDDGVAF